MTRRPHDPAESGVSGVPPASSPHRVRVLTNIQTWERITFLHWPVMPDVIQRQLPDGLRVDVRDGSAWVGVTPFRIRVRPLGMPFVPPGAVFPETNVRTYVVGPDGRQAIWFLHMEVTARWFVAALRMLGLPYVRRSMDVDEAAGVVHYRSCTTPRQDGGHDIVVRPGERLDPVTGGPFEQFLTARWCAYHRVGRLLLRTPVEHRPWVLRSATVERCDVGGLFDAAGLPHPTRSPLVYFSDGVDTRVGPARPA